MKNTCLTLTILVCGMFCCNSTAQADLMLRAEHVEAFPNSTGVGIRFFLDSDASNIVSGFNINIDIGGDGGGAVPPFGISYNAAMPISSTLFPTVDLDTATPGAFGDPYDAIGSDVGGPNLPPITSEIELFTIFLDLPAIPVNTVIPIDIVNTIAHPSIVSGPAQSSFDITSVTGGSITIKSPTTPIPEPATMISLAMCVGLAGTVVAKKLRLRKSAVSS